jgi:hypothetical protein
MNRPDIEAWWRKHCDNGNLALSVPPKGKVNNRNDSECGVQMKTVFRSWSEIQENLHQATRFLALRFFAGMTVIAGFCLMVPGTIAAILILNNGANLNSPPIVLAGFAVAVGAVLLGIPVVAFGQLLLCVVAIARNTDDAADSLKTIEKQLRGER